MCSEVMVEGEIKGLFFCLGFSFYRLVYIYIELKQ